MNMPSKIKPSTKEYKRDRNNRMTNQFTWKHYTVSGTSTEELQKLYKTLPRKRNIIKRELVKRGVLGVDIYNKNKACDVPNFN